MAKGKTDADGGSVKVMGSGSVMSRLNRTFICSVVFLDICDYSTQSVDLQIRQKDHLNKFVIEAIKDVAVNDRIILDTGDGAAIGFLGDPEDALFVALNLRDAILDDQKTGTLPFCVRIGMNLGPVKLVKDINGQPNFIGDGINVAQRVMAFAQPGQVLVSRSYYEVVSCLSQEYAKLFHYLGMKSDKHIREHEIYAVEQVKEQIAEPAAERVEKKEGTPDGAAAVPPAPPDKDQMSAPDEKAETPAHPGPSGSEERKAGDKSSPAAPRQAAERSTQRSGGGPRKILFIAIPAAIALIVAGLLILRPKGPSAEGNLKEGQTEASPEIKPGEPPAKGVDEDATVPKKATLEIAAKASAFVLFDIKPSGEVYDVLVDGKKVGSLPSKEFVQVPPGRHTIEIKNPSRGTFSQTVDLKPSENIKISHVFR